jgi:hypothetical protein
MMLEFSLADKRVRGHSKARRATVVPVASPSIVRMRRAGEQAIAAPPHHDLPRGLDTTPCDWTQFIDSPGNAMISGQGPKQ